MNIDLTKYQGTQDEVTGVITLRPIEQNHNIGWRPSKGDNYLCIDQYGDVHQACCDRDRLDQKTFDFGNCFPTKELAEKAAKLMARSNAIISACLEVDPDYVPDWYDRNYKWRPFYSVSEKGWQLTNNDCHIESSAYVSTREKCQQVCALLTARGVK